MSDKEKNKTYYASDTKTCPYSGCGATGRGTASSTISQADADHRAAIDALENMLAATHRHGNPN